MTRRLSCWVFEKRPAHCYVTIDVYLIVFAQCLVMHCKQDEQDRLSLAHESGGTKEYYNLYARFTPKLLANQANARETS